MVNARFATNQTLTIEDIRVNNGTLEIDFTSDKKVEEIETLMSNREAMTKVELLNSEGAPYCYYSNFTEFGGVYSKDKLKRGFAVQPKAEIEVRLNEVQTTANDALKTVQALEENALSLKEDVENATIAANEAADAATNVAQTTQASTEVSKIYAQTLEDDKALTVKSIYDKWEELVAKKFVAKEAGFKFTHNDILYKTAKADVPFQSQWVPGSGTESLYTVINETNKGTKDDPIPYAGNMTLENGKFYSQDGVVYQCIRDSGIPLHNALKDLVGNYVKVAN